MGFFTALVTLPLAPVRGAAWVVEQVVEEAERQADEESALRRELLQLDLDHDAGALGESEYRQRSDELLEQIARSHADAVARGASSVGTEWPYG